MERNQNREEQKEGFNRKNYEDTKKQLQQIGVSQQEINRVLIGMGFKNFVEGENSQPNRFQNNQNLMKSLIDQKFAQQNEKFGQPKKFQNDKKILNNQCANCQKNSNIICDCKAYSYCSQNCKDLYIVLRHKNECQNLQNQQNQRQSNIVRENIGGYGMGLKNDSEDEKEQIQFGENSYRGRGGRGFQRGGRGGRGGRGDFKNQENRGNGKGIKNDSEDEKEQEQIGENSFRGRGGRGFYRGGRGDFQNQGNGGNGRGFARGRGNLNSSYYGNQGKNNQSFLSQYSQNLNQSQNNISNMSQMSINEEKKQLNDNQIQKRKFFDTKREIEQYNQLLEDKNFEDFILIQEKKIYENIKSIFNGAEMDFKTVGGTQGLFQSLMSLLHKLLQNDEYEEDTSEIILKIVNMDFLSKDTFTQYQKIIQYRFKYDFKNIDNLKDVVDTLLYWCEVNDKIISILPQRQIQLPALEIQNYNQQLQPNIQKFTMLALDSQSKKLKEDYQLLTQKANLIAEKVNMKYPPIQNPSQNKKIDVKKQFLRQIMVENQIVNLPNNFRDLSINPTLDEINSIQIPFLHPIKKIGQFESLDHYLDANFRLLKEDFSKELRDGVVQLKDNKTQNLKLLINFYKNASVSGFFVSNNFFGLSLKIEQRRFGQSWEQSSKFMFGQLIIFSDDNFERNLFSGVIRHRNGKEMDQQQRQFGFVTIYIEMMLDENSLSAFQLFQQIEGKPITIIESKTYFEAYFHVLKCLQQTNKFPDIFEEMIVKVNHRVNQMPEMWNDIAMRVKLNKYIQDKGLDQYQSKAFMHAFQTTLSLIQGPPGTGKTFVGEKIVDFMIKNIERDASKQLKTGPLFLVCFTNHALDQFLEKNMESTSKVIRLGGRTKNENFKSLNINSVRGLLKQRLPQDFYDLRNELRSLQGEFDRLNKKFFQVCNIPLISLKMIVDHEQTLLQKFGQIQTFFQNESNKVKILNQVKNWLVQVNKQFNDEFKERNVSQSQLDKIETFLKRNHVINADVMSWLNILDVNLLVQISQEEEKEDENQEQDDDDDGYKLLDKFESYQEKNIDIENLIKQTDSVYKFLRNKPLCLNQSQNYAQLFDNYKNTIINDQQFQAQFNIFIATLVNVRQPENPFNLNERNKWLLNFGIIEMIRQSYQDQIQVLCETIKSKSEQMEDIRIRYDVLLMQKMDIIAMTTTGAAKYKNLLRKVRSKIMIVEEAAEILESHLFTSINNNLEQLVLIGDHQQLRPSLNVLELSQTYNLDLSMFERLIDNGFQFSKLITQRRMRPEISEVMRQIYPDLLDHPSVQNRENIRGFNNKNYFFFNHQFPEEEIQNMATKKNPMEAQFIIKFCEYLLKQNYTASQITILTLYAGQLLTVKGLQRNKPRDSEVKKIRICNVDDYQGEENDIIVMSLVRSNDKDQIGFLRASNRICVALSRARNGLFIFGNANCLKNAAIKLQEQEQRHLNKNDNKQVAQEHLWIKVLKILNDRNSIDDKLVLKCQNHSNETVIKLPEDFDNCPEGGCKLKCKTRMDCGHSCESYCHAYATSKLDQTGHDNVQCNKKCERKRNCGHQCDKLCFNCKKGKFDGHFEKCQDKVSIQLSCGHINKFHCYLNQELGKNLKCEVPCDKILNCGHKCRKLCKYECTEMYDSDIKKGYDTNCKQKVFKKLICGCEAEVDCGMPAQKFYEKEGCSTKKIFVLKCGHKQEGKCSQNIDKIICIQKCSQLLECGHSCPNQCNKCEGKIFHGQCNSKCGRMNVCNHQCQDMKCNQNCPPCGQNCKISCSHSNCPQKCGEPCQKCIEPCNYKCEHSKCKKKCFEICDRKPCKHPCKKDLDCGHKCIGFCGEECPQVCRVQFCKNYNDDTFEILFGNEQDDDAKFVLLEDCGHAIEEQALICFIDSQNKDNQIKYPECPKCKTLIQNCPRIQNILKDITRKVDKAKIKIMDDNNNFLDDNLKLKRIEEIKQLFNNQNGFMKSNNINFQWIQKVIDNCNKLRNSQISTTQQVVTAVAALNFSELFLHIVQYINDFNSQQIIQFFLDQYRQIQEIFEHIIQVNVNSDRLKKIGRILEVFDLSIQIKFTLNNQDSKGLYMLNQSLNMIIDSKFVLQENAFEKLKIQLKGILKDIAEQKKMIIEAIGLGSGHWYECPNGHPYVIGECGGAMQKSVCPECKCDIGGESHQLTQNNRFSQFGGGQRPAYDPDDQAANLRAALELQRQLNQI